MDITLGLYNSQKILLALANKGMKRQKAYEIVQRSAMRTWAERIPFKTTLAENAELMEYMTENEIEELFSSESIFQGGDYIFQRCEL